MNTGGVFVRSDIINVCASGEGVDEALFQAEAVAKYKGLSDKQALWLRLLSEEMMGMLRQLTGEVEARFFIEDEADEYRLHLITDTVMDREKRRKLMEASTDGTNIAAVGVMGKLRCLFERVFEPDEPGAIRFLDSGWMGTEEDLTGLYNAYWSLNNYRAFMQEKKDAEEWDELERSIVANLADEVRIGIKGGTVEMIIYKKMKKEN